VADFKIGDRVVGRIYGYEDEPQNYAAGTVVEIDNARDPKVKTDMVDPANHGHWEVGDMVWLSGRTTRLSAMQSLRRAGQGPLSARAQALREAESLITGDRNATYGEPTENFQDIARVWNVYLAPKLREGAGISPADTAWMMVALKMVRAKAAPTRDNWIDAAGYAACGLECDIAEGVIES
jgi:hypothetical protein